MNIPTEAIAMSLEMRANYIETGDVVLSTADLRATTRMGKSLSYEQLLLVQTLRQIAQDLRDHKLLIVRNEP